MAGARNGNNNMGAGRGGSGQRSEQARHGKRSPGDFLVRVLEEAEYPLSDAQISQIEVLAEEKLTRAEMHDKVTEILSDDQKAALEEAHADRGSGGPGGNPVERMQAVLDEAGEPLSEDQISALETIEPGKGMREKIAEILSDEQEEALQALRKNAGGRQRGNGRGARPRMNHTRMLSHVLDEAGVPLTEDQISALEDVGRDPEAREQVEAILTTEQAAALEKVAEERRAKHNEMLAAILEKAGVPLSDSQLSEIEALEAGPETREQIAEILSEEQNEALRAARPKGRGHHGRGPGGGPFGALKEASCPLTEEQFETLRAMPKDSDRKEALMSVLTEEQKAVLAALDDETAGEEASTGAENIEAAGKLASAEETPDVYSLKQNYPNPFNPSTSIDYSLGKAADVKIEIYSPGGQYITTLVNEHQSAGMHTVVWNASERAAGIYIYKMTTENGINTGKMTLMK